MKNLKITFLFLCICVVNGYAQDNLLYDGIQRAKSSGEKFETVSAFTLASKNTSQSQRIQKYFISPQEVHILHYGKPAAKNLNASMTLDVPLGGKILQLELQEVYMEYLIMTNDGQKVPQNKNIRHYQGIVKDDPNSIVAITFAEDEIIGLIAGDEGNFNLVLDKQLGEHIFYNEKNLKQKSEFVCDTQTDNYPDVYSPEVLFRNSRSSDRVYGATVRLYFETEFDIYQTHGSNVGNVETFIAGLYNQVAVLYRNEGINTALSEIHIWTATDPYTSTTTTGLLAQFQNHRTSFNGDLGQLVTFRNIGGGLAAGNDGLCNNNTAQKLSVAMLYNTFNNVPTYSWSVCVVTHEFGHLFGSRHTHACVWNGNNTAIDGCAGFTEPTNPSSPGYGSCPVPAIPANGGTIMSYCHSQNAGINFNLGFGLQPGNVIRNSVENANCLPAISGPPAVCKNQSATFTLVNKPSNTVFVTWNRSVGRVTFTGTQGGDNAPFQYYSNGADTIIATINNIPVVVKKPIRSGKSSINTI